MAARKKEATVAAVRVPLGYVWGNADGGDVGMYASMDDAINSASDWLLSIHHESSPNEQVVFALVPVRRVALGITVTDIKE